MLTVQRQNFMFQQEWTGKGERGFRDSLLIPAIFFGAVSPGLYLSSLLTGYLPGCWAALIMNFIGYGVTHLLFLGRMERFWRAMLNWRTSWISRGFLFNAFFTGFGVLSALSRSMPLPLLDISWVGTLLMILSAVSAVLFAAYPGFMLSTVKAIPFWRSALEPIIFFLQGLLGGTAIQIMLVRVASFDLSWMAVLLKLNFVLLLAVLLLIMAALIIKARHGGTEKKSVEFLFAGDFSRMFIIGALAAGLIIPLIILTLGVVIPLDFDRYGSLYYGAMLMELAGTYLAKYSILRAGAYSPIQP